MFCGPLGVHLHKKNHIKTEKGSKPKHSCSYAVGHHIISIFATMDESCLIQLWSKMILQMQNRLTMLRTSRNISKLTAYEEIKGTFHWNRTPMAPLGNKGVVYITLGMRNTFTPPLRQGVHHWLCTKPPPVPQFLRSCNQRIQNLWHVPLRPVPLDAPCCQRSRQDLHSRRRPPRGIPKVHPHFCRGQAKAYCCRQKN